MIAFGCLAPLVLCVIGAVVGHVMAGMTGAIWGFFVGLAVGGVFLGLSFFVLEKVKEDGG